MDYPAWGTFLREYVRRLPDGDERRADETDRPFLPHAHAVLSKCRTMHEAGADGGLDRRVMPDGWCAATPYREYGCYAGEHHRCGEAGPDTAERREANEDLWPALLQVAADPGDPARPDTTRGTVAFSLFETPGGEVWPQ